MVSEQKLEPRRNAGRKRRANKPRIDLTANTVRCGECGFIKCQCEVIAHARASNRRTHEMVSDLQYPIGEVDADGLDEVEALVADATAVEGVANVHEGGGYFAERVIRRAIQQGTLKLATPRITGGDEPGATPTDEPSDEYLAELGKRVPVPPLTPITGGDELVERVARIVELAIMRHGIEEAALEGTLDDAADILRLTANKDGLVEALEEARDVLAGMNDDEINEELLPRLSAIVAAYRDGR